ncbi:variable surface protein [Plasmodium gonderi]|uniref:Variable surface protein n=1 Tax=Plasmodium gonderi TaxID=77519 RepID=A0A1Y1JQ05_PLAGO|nr:variable surface protein [Plasmodium gonderi]GAW84706.1 variable surface protein [Plasmodium gonderi]
MTNIALYFKQLKNQYPFLRNVWDAYDNFDEPVDLSNRNKLYHEFCNQLISRVRTDKKKHYDLCVKLIRNLKLFCHNTGECKFDSNDCNNLNNWLFISIVKDQLIPYFYIYIFNLIKRISPNLSYQNECLYYFYGKNYFEPLSIVILNIFQSNIDLIRQTLIGSKDKIYCSCQQFVYNVVRRYKHINSIYCHVDQTKLREKNKNTCLFLKQFETTYDAYLINDGSIQKKKVELPSLKHEDTLEFVPCIPDDGIHQSLSINEVQIPPEEPVELFETELNDQMDLFQNPEYFTTSVFIKNVLPTTLAIIAAASSLFFLIYKFTPIRSLFRSRKIVKTVRNIYDRDNKNELLYDAYNTMDISSYNNRYDIAYGNL